MPTRKNTLISFLYCDMYKAKYKSDFFFSSHNLPLWTRACQTCVSLQPTNFGSNRFCLSWTQCARSSSVDTWVMFLPEVLWCCAHFCLVDWLSALLNYLLKTCAKGQYQIKEQFKLKKKNGWTVLENYDFTPFEIVLNKKYLFNWFAVRGEGICNRLLND